MNETSQWFESQLLSTMEGLVWSVRQVPAERQLLAPPAVLGDWSAARHLFHMLIYEEQVALPSMRIWLGEPGPEVFVDEDEAWQALRAPSLVDLCQRFQAVRQAQVGLVTRFGSADWEKALMTVWHEVRLFWVVSKTFQHTAEHTHDIMRLALFWDVANTS